MSKVPILIVLPFWKGDFTQAIEICKICAGLQTNHVGNAATFMLACRQDFSVDKNMVNIISRKFNTLTFKCTSPLRGWPQGPNGMFGSTMINISNNHKDKFECVYWLEPDAVPIRPNWFHDLVLEWRKKSPSAKIVGCRADCNGNGTGDHITGCALYDPNIARILPIITKSDGIAWDYQHRAKILQIGGSTKLIQNRYRQTNVHHGIIDEAGVVIIHGVKGNSLTDAVKRKYNIH